MGSGIPEQQEVLYEYFHGPYPPGDFYVEEHECVTCGYPAHLAPDLIRHRPGQTGSCYFYKQPSTPSELDQAIAAVEGSCVCAVRYRGSDPTILARISDMSIDSPTDVVQKVAGVAMPSLIMGSNEDPRPILSTPKLGFLESLLKRLK